jgi:hypothetical protein
MDINTVITEIENTGAIILEYRESSTYVEFAITSTDYDNFKQVLLIIETDCLPDYPAVHSISYAANLCKFKSYSS